MSKKALFLIVISISLVASFINSFKAPISIDPVLDKLLACNRTHFTHHEFSAYKFEKDIVHINEHLAKLKIKGKRSFFQELSVYYKNLGKINDHGPVFSSLARLPIIRSLDLWGLRLLNFIFFVLSLLVLNALMKLLLFSNQARYLSLITMSLSILSQEIMLYGRVYALGILLNLVCSYLFIKIVKSNKNLVMNTILLLICIHLCFLNYFFYTIYLPVIFCGLSFYLYINQKEITIQKIFQSLAITALSLFSLIVHLDLVKLSIGLGQKRWVIRNIELDLVSNLKNLLETYTTLFSPSFKEPFALIITVLVLILALWSKNLSKLIPLLLGSFAIPIAMLCLDYYFHSQTHAITRYSFAALPMIFMVYGLIFATRPKILITLLALSLLIPSVFPSLKNPNRMYDYDPYNEKLINAAKAFNKKDFENKKTLVIPNMRIASQLIFSKYLVENFDGQSALFDQSTNKEIYVLTDPFIDAQKLIDEVKAMQVNNLIFIYNNNHQFENYAEHMRSLYAEIEAKLKEDIVLKTIYIRR